MISGLRDPRAAPLEPERLPSHTAGYVHTVNHHGDESSVLRGYVDGLEAYRQAVWLIVHTERGAYPNTPPNAGIKLAQFINNTPNFFRARIENVMRSALMQDDRTLEVHLLRTENTGPRSVAAWFLIVSVFGELIEGFLVPLSSSGKLEWLSRGGS